MLLVGVVSFLEQPLAQKLDAFRLGAALRLGALVLAVAALDVGRGSVMPMGTGHVRPPPGFGW